MGNALPISSRSDGYSGPSTDNCHAMRSRLALRLLMKSLSSSGSSGSSPPDVKPPDVAATQWVVMFRDGAVWRVPTVIFDSNRLRCCSAHLSFACNSAKKRGLEVRRHCERSSGAFREPLRNHRLLSLLGDLPRRADLDYRLRPQQVLRSVAGAELQPTSVR